jgi:hypothetical protein
MMNSGTLSARVLADDFADVMSISGLLSNGSCWSLGWWPPGAHLHHQHHRNAVGSITTFGLKLRCCFYRKDTEQIQSTPY